MTIILQRCSFFFSIYVCIGQKIIQILATIFNVLFNHIIGTWILKILSKNQFFLSFISLEICLRLIKHYVKLIFKGKNRLTKQLFLQCFLTYFWLREVSLLQTLAEDITSSDIVPIYFTLQKSFQKAPEKNMQLVAH